MKQKGVKFSIVRRLPITLISLLCIVIIGSSPAFAISFSDYFTIDYDIELSKSIVRGNETFYADIDGTATCHQDLPLSVTEGYVTSRVVATHRDSGTEVILNSSYTINIDPFPDDEGEITEVSEVVSLNFPSSSQSGSYDLEAKLTRARINTAEWGWFTVTLFLPSTQDMGSVTYVPSDGDGGGGGGIPIGTDTDISDYIDDSGAFTDDFTFESEDGVCQLSVGEDTIGLTEDGEPIGELTIVEMEDPPNPPQDATVIGLTYKLGPTGASFDPPITITFTYDPSLLPEGVSEQSLVLAMWDEDTGEWVVLEGYTVDVGNHTISVSAGHFTPFSILAYTRSATFEVIDLTINPEEVSAGQTVAIVPLIANTGDLSGSYEVTLRINDTAVETKEITIAGGTEDRVAFIITRDAAGTYTVNVDDLSGTFKVKEPPPPTPAAFTTGELRISPAEVDTGEEVTISVAVANTGGLAGSYEVTLKIDDTVVETKQVTVAGGGSKPVSFSVSRDAPGVYQVSIDDLSGTFEVKAAPKPTNRRLIIIIIAAVIATAIPVAIRWRRRIA